MNEDFELDKKLYEVSDLHDTDAYVYEANGKLEVQLKSNYGARSGWWWCEGINAWPLYDFEYLLDKLPQFIELDEERNGQLQIAHDDPEINPEQWLCRYPNTGLYGRSSTLRLAALKLILSLFDNGILKRERTE